MKRTEIAKLYAAPEAYVGAPVTVCGWIRTNRDSKTLGFMDVNDGSCFKGVQVVFQADKVADFAAVAKLNVGTAVVVTGDLILTPEAKQPFEINATSVEVEGASTPDYPLQKKRHSVEYLRSVHCFESGRALGAVRPVGGIQLHHAYPMLRPGILWCNSHTDDA